MKRIFRIGLSLVTLFLTLILGCNETACPTKATRCSKEQVEICAGGKKWLAVGDPCTPPTSCTVRDNLAACYAP